MRWVLVALGAYGIAMVALIAIAQYAARADQVALGSYPLTDGYAIEVYLDYPLPFHLNGAGHPGTVELFEYGHVIDSERVDDAYSVHDVQFDRYKAYFRYESHGAEYRGSFQVIQ